MTITITINTRSVRKKIFRNTLLRDHNIITQAQHKLTEALTFMAAKKKEEEAKKAAAEATNPTTTIATTANTTTTKTASVLRRKRHLP